jgi:hypothetical protein
MPLSRRARLALSLLGLATCSSPTPQTERSSEASTSAEAIAMPRYEPVREVPWIEAEIALREKRALAAIPTRDRRVHLTLPDGCWTTTAPTDSALVVVLSEVDPKHVEIGTTEWFLDYREIPFSHATRILRDGKVYSVRDNDRGRLLFVVHDDDRTRYVTYAPPNVHVATLLRSASRPPITISHHLSREIRWREAQDLLRAFPPDVSFLHGGSILVDDPGGGPTREAYDPGDHAADRFLKEIDPQRKISITVE